MSFTNATLKRNSQDRVTRLRMESLEDRRLLATLPELVALTDASGLYSGLDEIRESSIAAESYLSPTTAVPFSVEMADLRSALADAPMEFTAAGFDRPLEFSIPKPDGTMGRFSIVEAPVMHPDLAAKYPEIKTYRGQGIDNPAETIRFDVTPQGFHAQVLSPDGAYYVDPYYHLDTSVYVSYSGAEAGYSEQAEQLGTSFRELGVVEDDVVVTQNGSFELGEDGSLTAIEGGDRFNVYTTGNYEIQDDGSITVAVDSDVMMTYSADEFHLHNDGTVHVRVSADGEKSGGGCPGCGGVGCRNCGPAQEVGYTHEEASIDTISEADTQQEDQGDDAAANALRTGETLRTYRLANASTIEYTNFHGGTKAAGMAAIVTAVNRVTGIYETELTIRMELVPNNDDLVFTSSTGDPYSNNNGVAMLNQNQSEIDSTIGNANYDIGHVFSTGGGGVAGLGVVGRTGQKARGVTGLGVPNGDAFYVDYVAHEMGHQFGGSHTFNGDSGSCGGQRSGSSAYEPGSGSTIQAYAGICGNDNIQNNSDPYFHSRSLDQMIGYVDGAIAGVGTRTSTGNSEPVADAGPNYEIPANTPFLLTGSGTDPDGDALTYNWEQRDLGPQADVNAADNGSSPLIRSRMATTSPTRFLPREANLIANNYNQVGERLPTVARRMDFRLTVRDNASGGGAVDTDDMWVDINDTGTPFRVTNQSGGGAWLAGDVQQITWDVAGTDSGQINTPNVDIIISDDGGFTYTIPLATGIPNNGSYTFNVPNIPEISQARFMVKGSGNIFFDINDQNFAIIGDDTAPPTANANLQNVTNAGGVSTFIAVTYTDNQAVDASDIGPGDLEVVAPDGSILPVDYISRSSNVDTTPITGNYRLFAPGGSWDFVDNGTYSLRFVAGEVTDVDENGTLADLIVDTFEVNVPTPPGDFNGDGELDCEDIDMLSDAVASGMNDPAFDVTGEGVLNYNDVRFWVEDLKGTILADANLDFSVNGADFLIWNANKFTSGTSWCTGDFNADGQTNGADFLIWNDNKFQSADTLLLLPERAADLGTTDSPERLERTTPIAPPAAVTLTVEKPVRADVAQPIAVTSVVRPLEAASRSDDAGQSEEDWPTMVERLFAFDA